MVQFIIIIVAILFIIVWLSLMFERIYKFKTRKFYEILNLAQSNNADQLIEELDEIFKEQAKKEWKLPFKLNFKRRK